jgi:hypothetical protein
VGWEEGRDEGVGQGRWRYMNLFCITLVGYAGFSGSPRWLNDISRPCWSNSISVGTSKVDLRQEIIISEMIQSGPWNRLDPLILLFNANTTHSKHDSRRVSELVLL